jgi:hypothetical protein
MTPGQLIDLLEKAGMLKEESPGVLGWHPTMQKAERFAALVAAAEREACAAIARQWDVDHPGSNYGGCIARLLEARGQA